MPKREPTPPLDDDLKYFVVHYPYPPHADMKIPEDRETFAKWVACCIDMENIYAIYHKPSAPNMVIIEVAKNCPDVNNRLLGAHKYKEFLKDPSQDIADMESRVYYCFYTKGRDVQKSGWKRIDVHDLWFKGWRPETSEFITTPYPAPQYCDLPVEFQTEYRLCRPLPQTVFPKLKPKAPPVPGSSAWVSNKASGPGNQVLSKPKRDDFAAKHSSRSSASSTTMTKVEINRSSSASTASSDTSTSSPVSLEDSVKISTIPPPPGLGPPPGLRAPVPQVASKITAWKSVSQSESVSKAASVLDSDDWDFPTSDAIVSSGDVAGEINIGNMSISNEEDVDYWAEAKPWKVDWDKQICPTHKQACKAGICQDMARIERQRRREAAEKERLAKQATAHVFAGDDDGWTETESKRGRGWRGRGTGGRGWGTSSNSDNPWRGRRGGY